MFAKALMDAEYVTRLWQFGDTVYFTGTIQTLADELVVTSGYLKCPGCLGFASALVDAELAIWTLNLEN